MTWRDAKLDAETIRPLQQTGRLVTLPAFEDPAALGLFAPQHGWTLAYYRMVLQAAARAHKTAGLKLRLLKISSEDYLKWLHGRADSPELRAGFIASRLAAPRR